MDISVKISYLNDFIFCPVSIYFHNLYEAMEKEVYQSDVQYNGSVIHRSIDQHKYTSKKNILQAIPVYSERFHLTGNIDLYDTEKEILVERKKHVNIVYDGYIFQLYAQYYCLVEMGYTVKKMVIYSYDDNKRYPIPLPDESPEMKEKFMQLINDINRFDIETYVQTNAQKCCHCIYYPSCDRGLKC